MIISPSEMALFASGDGITGDETLLATGDEEADEAA